MNRSTMTLLGTVVALAAMTGVAALAAPGGDAAGGTGTAAAGRKPVERSTLVCPQPSTSDVAETSYTAFTPKGAEGTKGSAALYPAERATGVGDAGGGQDGKDAGDAEAKGAKGGKGDKHGKDGSDGSGEGGRSGEREGDGAAAEPDAEPFLPLHDPGTPVTDSTDDSTAPALVGSADGRFAPGWTVQQTTEVGAGAGRGLQGTACSAPDTDFWFPGASTAEGRQDYVHLTNPDSTGAVVDIDLYGKDGKVRSEAGEGVTIPPRSTVPVLLSTLAPERMTNVTVHVVSRTGRVGAQVQAVDEKLGGDWLPPTADPAPSVVLPGIPKDATAVRLVAFAPGGRDADLDVRLSGRNGRIAPAGHESLHLRAGATSAVDLGDLTKGEAGSLELTPADDGAGHATPVVAALRVTRGKGGDRETAFIPATAPVDERATAADNGSGDSLLTLTATGRTARVRVTASAGSGGGDASSRTLTVKGGTTTAFAPPAPRGGKGTYAVTVERLSGGPLYAARQLAHEDDGVPEFTVQTLPDDRGTVAVPDAGQDLSVLTED